MRAKFACKRRRRFPVGGKWLSQGATGCTFTELVSAKSSVNASFAPAITPFKSAYFAPPKRKIKSVRRHPVPSKTRCMTKSPAVSANSSSARYDLVVVGGTPAGIACAVRAAREGVSVLLVNRHGHLGGILASGLAVWDTLWEWNRAPIYDEVRAAIVSYYKETYGEDSPQYRDCLPAKTGHLVGRFESSVAEKILTDLVAREKAITVWRNLVPVAVTRNGRRVEAVTLRPTSGGPDVTVAAGSFADCTYEGDVAALAGVPYRVGREAREEFGEPHAGIIFMQPRAEAPSPEAAQLAAQQKELRLRRFSGWQVIMPESTGAADGAVQACNYRTTLTTNPANRLPVPKPADYDPYYLRSLETFAGIECVPNDKYGWNRPQLVGQQTAYVEADWETRQRILDEHWSTTMGLLYFLQHDSTVPGIVRRAWLEFGLPKDEYADNGHRPYELYVRETRRITGRAIFTEHDSVLAPGLQRAPTHRDSIAMTEWYLDSHSCTRARVPGGLEEGKMMLHQESFPGQVPYRCLLPQGVDNLIVPVCLSATHVGWNAVRLEPVLMQTGEAAGLAVALAGKSQTSLADLDPDRLVRGLCERRSMVTFFNDVDVGRPDPWVPAAQYFGTRGFFHDYNARANAPLKRTTAKIWADAFGKTRAEETEPDSLSAAVLHAESGESPPVTAAEFEAMVSPGTVPAHLDATVVLTRGQALHWLWTLLP